MIAQVIFRTVFEISPSASGAGVNYPAHTALGVVFLAVGIVGLILRKKYPEKLPGRSYQLFLFLTAFGTLWLIMTIPFWISASAETGRLYSLYKSGQCSVIEGPVHVAHAQPYGGHDSGDQVVVNGKTFTVDYYHLTPGYRQTISHGGVLREGTYARLTYYDETILKVEIAHDDSARPAPR